MAKYQQLASSLKLSSSSGGSAASGAYSGGSTSLSSSVRASLKDMFTARLNELISYNNGITLPGFYQQAADEIYGDYKDDADINAEYWKQVAKGKEEQIKRNEVTNELTELDAEFREDIKTITSTFKNSPETLTSTLANAYMQYEMVLEDVRLSRLQQGLAVADVLEKQNEIGPVATEMASIIAGPSLGIPVQEVNSNLVWEINSDPDTGKIIEMQLKPVDAVTEDGYKLTNTDYAGFNIYGKESVDPTTGQPFIKIGQDKYVYTVNEEAAGDVTPIFKKTNKTTNWWGKVIEEPVDGKVTTDLSQTQLATAFDMPDDSVVKDARGNLYWKGNDGWFKAEDQNKLSQYTGKTIEDITSAPTVSLEMVGMMNNLYQDDGSTRMINDELLGRFPQGTPQLSELTRSTEPTPARAGGGLIGTPEIQMPTPQIPRKEAAMKEPTEQRSTFDRAQSIFQGLFGR